MSPMPDGWSVAVQGSTVVVTFPPGDEMGRRSFTVDEARAFWEQLGFAHLLAGRNRATGETDVDDVDADRAAGSPLPDDALHLEPVDVSDDLSKLGDYFRARRQAALVAAGDDAAEDQAWVDDISQFNDDDFETHEDLPAGGSQLADQEPSEKRSDRVEDQAAPADEDGIANAWLDEREEE
ncbi:hypothetical protein ACK280_19855 [Mycobacterium sherrisii]|uniref:hypothetical protein n=1 Tax=Mycobacterium sherrisii TaxID=243061 RepID=UPI003976E277